MMAGSEAVAGGATVEAPGTAGDMVLPVAGTGGAMTVVPAAKAAPDSQPAIIAITSMRTALQLILIHILPESE